MASNSSSRATAPPEHANLNSVVIVLLMGQTGVGKSHVRILTHSLGFNLGKLTRAPSQFINVAAGEDLAPVCDGLTNEDDTIRHFTLRNPEDPKTSLILVDTPGLDNYDVRANDLILQNIRGWINKQYEYLNSNR
ncbi:hypothetical protein EST38_g12794 [Candolleomyces aberdarensis]|uniref:G domain-containing protein n=1 Tax=Candolleomyces aberdarensis TaxID=2316362 RepID=A0A4Q2D1J2_9AGAR|nr:hypothetical protein EST38_g12794 [Candolleomyces aberdarensis]